MTVITKVHFSHPDMALADVIRALPDADIRVLQDVSTDPVHGQHFFTTDADDAESFERHLAEDHTVTAYRQVADYENQPVYSVEFTADTLLLGPAVVEQGGFALEAFQHEGGWVERWQLPDRESLQAVWEVADDRSFEFDILELYRVSFEDRSTSTTLTDKQQEALATAYTMGYFEHPQETDLAAVADALGISTSAASGRIRRGISSLVESFPERFPDVDAP
ncbi:MAG: helix-turn-helix domain-containing protein [Halobellus sp.]